MHMQDTALGRKVRAEVVVIEREPARFARRRRTQMCTCAPNADRLFDRKPRPWLEPKEPRQVGPLTKYHTEATMGFGKGALLWLIGVPLPIILLLALFMHH
jgi:hypothetical protein